MVVGSIPEHVCTSERMNERMPGGAHLLIRALISELKAKVNVNEKQCVNELLVYTWVVYFCLLNGLWDQCCHHFFIKVNHQCILYASGSVCIWVWVWMATWQQNSCHIAIEPFRKSQSNSQMVIRWLFFLQIVIQPFDQLYPNLTNGNSVTVLLLNCHLAVQTQTQRQTEPEVFRNAIIMSRKNVIRFH